MNHLLHEIKEKGKYPKKQEKGPRRLQLMVSNFLFIIKTKYMEIVYLILPKHPYTVPSSKD